VVSQLLSLPVLAVCVLALPGHPYGVDLLWGAGAGAAGVIGVILLYASLASGAMAVAAPTSAVTGAGRTDRGRAGRGRAALAAGAGRSRLRGRGDRAW
jgi:hypothetical protein